MQSEVLKNMRLQNNIISNTHHSLIFLDVDGVINTTFSKQSSEGNVTSNYYEETIGKELAIFFFNNKEDLDNFVIYDDINGDISRLFPDDYLLVDTLSNFDDDICQKIKDIVVE